MTFLPTPFAARQFVNHGHVLVNGKRVNILSYTLRDGDTVELKKKAKQFAIVLEAAKSAERDVPDYLCRRRFLQARRRVPYPVSMEPNLVWSSSTRADFGRLPAQPRPTAALAFSCAAASSSFQMGGLYFSGMRINPATIAITPAMVMAKGKPCWVMRIVERMPP